MVNKTLFILTKTYPFGRGEEYITVELEVLSQHFHKVILYPNDYYSENTSHHRDLPKNVEILNLNQWLLKYNAVRLIDYWYLIKNTIIECIQTDDKKFFFKNFKWNLINFWTQYKLTSIFSDYLKQNNYNTSNSIFYSYWFHKSAIFLSVLKDRKHIHKYIARAHSIDLYHNYWGIINDQVKVPPFKIFKLKQVDVLFSVSQHGTNFLKEHYPEYKDKFITQYLGVKSLSSIFNEIVDDNFFHIVTCSGIDSNKRVHKLAEALMEINEAIKWTHFGDGELVEELKKITNSFPRNISFDFKGKTPNQDVLQYYQNNEVNLFVNLSIVEGLPVSIMEAMMFEIPILATSVYGTPEAVIEGKNGFLIDVNFRIEDLVSKINYCLTHRKDLEIMGRKSREIYLDKFNAEKNYSEFANCLKTI